MNGAPGSPLLLKAGLLLFDPVTLVLLRTIVLQYNPDQLTRTLQVQAASGEGGDRSEALRLKGPPVETFKLEADIDATDQIEHASPADPVIQVGIHPQLYALEALITPTSTQLDAAEAALQAGLVEIAPAQAPLAVFVWSVQRVAPVRVTDFSVTEEAFDAVLNPIRAKVNLGLRVLSVHDVGAAHPAGRLFMGYLRNKEALAARALGGAGIDALGLTQAPLP